VFLIPPAVGLSQTLLNKNHEEEYYQGCPAGPGGEILRRHGDQMARLHGGFFKAHGRADDTMNLGGIKVSSLELEQVVNTHPSVDESAAISVRHRNEGAEVLVLFAVLKEKRDKSELIHDLKTLIAGSLNPLFKIHDLVVTDGLPRTPSNKLMRRKLREHYIKVTGS